MGWHDERSHFILVSLCPFGLFVLREYIHFSEDGWCALLVQSLQFSEECLYSFLNALSNSCALYFP